MRLCSATHRAALGILLGAQLTLGCAKPAPPAPAPAQVELEWDQSQSHVFELSVSSSTELSGAPAATPLVLLSDLQLSFRGDVAKQRVQVQLVNPHFASTSGQASLDTAPLVAELQKPYGVELSHGVITAYLEPPSPAAPVTGFRRHIASALQWAEHTSQPSWHSVEWDATGLCNVAYSARPNTANAWDWQKLGYQRLVIAEKRAAEALDTSKVAPKVESAQGTLTTDKAGIVGVERNERLSVPLSGSTTLLTTTLLKLRRTGFAPALSDAQWQARTKDTERAEVGSPAPVFNQALTDQARIGTHTFPEVVAKLKELDASKSGEHPSASEAGPLFHALVGIFRQQPKTIDAALELIRSRAKLGETLLDALAMASTPPALQTIGRVVFDPSLPKDLRVRAAGSLIRAQAPDPASLELVAKLIDEPGMREHGLYGVGSFVRQLREHGNAVAAEAGTKLLARQLELAKTPSDLATVLLAISNSGSAELFAPVVRYQTHADETVRRAAIQAIRLMPQIEAETRLRELLGNKDRGDVEAALHALGRRPQVSRESVDRVEDIAKKDPAPELRREAVLALGLWSQTWPALVPVLAEIHEHDADARVRDVAKPIDAP